jgi:type VI secretion system protein VasI
MHFKKIKIITVMFSLFLFQHYASAIVVSDEKIDACKNEPEKVNRLACFDNLFLTPISNNNEQNVDGDFAEISNNRNIGRIEKLANELEKIRQSEVKFPIKDENSLKSLSDVDNWTIRFSRNNHYDLMDFDKYDEAYNAVLNNEKIEAESSKALFNVYLSTPEILPADRTNVEIANKLLISCENDITTVHLILDKSIRTHIKEIKFENNNGGVRNLIWQDIENGRVLIIGRGLNSIDFIKSLSAMRRVQFTLEVDKKQRVIIFDVSNLLTYLSPIRTQCHW